MRIISIILLFTLGKPYFSAGQKNYSTTQLSFFSGISFSDVNIPKPYWLKEGNNNSIKGKSFGLDISHRVYREVWIGMGMGYFRRNYSFRRRDVYDPLINDTRFFTANYGFDIYAKVDYIRHLRNYYVSGSYLQILDFNVINKLLIYYPNGDVKASQDANYLFGYPRNRSAVKLTFGRKVGIKKRITLGLDFNYSFDLNNKKSMELDRMNIRTTTLSLSLIRNFGSKNYSHE